MSFSITMSFCRRSMGLCSVHFLLRLIVLTSNGAYTPARLQCVAARLSISCGSASLQERACRTTHTAPCDRHCDSLGSTIVRARCHVREIQHHIEDRFSSNLRSGSISSNVY